MYMTVYPADSGFEDQMESSMMRRFFDATYM